MRMRSFLAGIVAAFAFVALAGGILLFGRDLLVPNVEASASYVPRRAPSIDYGPQKVVYHVSSRGSWRDRESEARRLVAVLNNHVNALEPDRPEIRVILQGDGIDVLRRASANAALGRSIDTLRRKGVSWTPALTSRVFGFHDSIVSLLIWRRDDGAAVAFRIVGTSRADQQDWGSA